MTSKTAEFAAAAAMMETAPRLDRSAGTLSVEIYRQLAAGQPVEVESLAGALGLGIPDVRNTLESEQLRGWTFYDKEGRIIGFRGLAIQDMPHRFEVEGRTLYTWCAMDGLFIPEVLGLSARLESQDPRTGSSITLDVTPDGIRSVSPTETVMSILVGDTDVVRTEPAKIMASFCHHIFFFESVDSGTEWAAEHGNGTFLVTLDEAFALGRQFNEAQYGKSLGRR